MEKLFSAYRGDAPYVFVCYAHDDSTTVYPELAQLRDEGANIWYDEGISAGANWRAVIGESLLGADRVLFYISHRSLASDHCNREINLALDQGKEVVPIYLEDVELTPDLMVGLNRIQALHKHRDTDYYTHLFDALGLAAPATVLEEGASPATPRRRGLRRWQVAGGTFVLALALLGTWAYFDVVERRDSYSLAVLSFEDLNAKDETGVLARRFSETVLDHLARAAPNPNYGKPRLGYRADSFGFAMQNAKASEIGDALGVGYLIDGSLERSGDTYLVNTQVIRAADGTEIWSKAYDVDISDDVEGLLRAARNAAHIALSVVQMDLTELDIDHPVYSILVASNLGTNTEAARHFFAWYRQFRLLELGLGGDLGLRDRHLQRAIEADPEFAIAFAVLANLYLEAHWLGEMSYEDVSRGAHVNINRALELSPDDPQTLLQLAQIAYQIDLDYANAEAVLDALSKRQRDDTGYWAIEFGLARIALREGRIAEAQRRAATADAVSVGHEEQIRFLLSNSLMQNSLGQHEAALELTSRALDVAFDGRNNYLALWSRATTLNLLGRTDEARPFVEEALGKSNRPGKLVWNLVQIGDVDRAAEIAVRSGTTALGYLSLGDVDNCFERLRQAIDAREFITLEHFPRASWWDPVRDDPRFAEMIELLESKVTHTPRYLVDMENNADVQSP